jgi:hypothetical protein
MSFIVIFDFAEMLGSNIERLYYMERQVDTRTNTPMNLYNHMQQVEAMQQDVLRKSRERQHYEFIAQSRSQIRQLSLWRVLWAWFKARPQTQDYEETLEVMLRLLQPRKAKVVQSIYK